MAKQQKQTMSPSLADLTAGDGEDTVTNLGDTTSTPDPTDDDLDAVDPPAPDDDPEGDDAADDAEDPAAGEDELDVDTDPVDDPDADTDDPELAEQRDFYKGVEALTGVKIVEEGEDFSLDTKGLAGYLEKFREKVEQNLDDSLQKTAPRAYAYYLHQMSGGSDEEFFAKTREEVPTDEVLKTSADTQEQFYVRHLISTGLDEETAKTVARLAKDDEKLEEKVLAVAAQKRTAIQTADAEAAATAKQKADALEAEIKTTSGTIADLIVNKGKVGDLIIPAKERQAFNDFFQGMVRYQDNKYYLVSEMDKTKLDKTIQQMYIRFKDGDLSGLVKSAARGGAVVKLGDRKTKAPLPGAGGNNQGGSSKANPPLSAIK